MARRNQFSGKNWIILQPRSVDVPFGWTFTVCTTQTSNDGGIPYGTTISSVAVSAFDANGDDATAALINGTPGVADNIVTANFDWPGAGEYKVTFILTLDTGTIIEKDFGRIRCEDY